jgi:hypothetical protein
MIGRSERGSGRRERLSYAAIVTTVNTYIVVVVVFIAHDRFCTISIIIIITVYDNIFIIAVAD